MLLVLVLLILHSVLPASAATLTITPQSQAMNIAYALTVSNQTDLATSHVRARMLTYTTSTRSESTSVLTPGVVDATSAHGQVVFSQISAEIKWNANVGLDLGNKLTLVPNKTTVMMPGNTYTVPMHIQQPGSAGNLPADSIDGFYRSAAIRLGQLSRRRSSPIQVHLAEARMSTLVPLSPRAIPTPSPQR